MRRPPCPASSPACGNSPASTAARELPFPDGHFAVATEPPYDVEYGTAALPEIISVLAPGGRLAMLWARWQVEPALRTARDPGLEARLEAPIDRKGLECSIACAEKAKTT